jgi:hypothetical protein
MRNRLLGSTIALAVTWAAWSLTSTPAAGQQAPPAKPTSYGGCPAETLAFHACAQEKAKTFSPPRTPDGVPDMQGYWRDQLTHGFSVEGVDESDPETRNKVQPWPIGPGMIVDPPDRKIPYQPWAAKVGRKGVNFQKYIDPTSSCRPYSPPRDVQVSPFHQLLQPPGGDAVLWLMEEVHAYRVIHMDGRPHVGKGVKLWKGDAVGRWEGNTLVVDVTNFTDRTWVVGHGAPPEGAPASSLTTGHGVFHSEALHVVERFTLIDADTIRYEATIEDPSVFTRPWKIDFNAFTRAPADHQLFEYACHEGNSRNIKMMTGFDIERGVR